MLSYHFEIENTNAFPIENDIQKPRAEACCHAGPVSSRIPILKYVILNLFQDLPYPSPILLC
jgi:hypothetical protein